MKVAINKKYKYITLEEYCPADEAFDDWVMQPKFETHSIISIPNDIGASHLRFRHFDYNEATDTFAFNADKYSADIISASLRADIIAHEQAIRERQQAYVALLTTGADEAELAECKAEIETLLQSLEVLRNAS